ncbi:MAG: hypothetical protein HY554_08195 [Elusimicrobia bacterium]|nr:hypothetical protein [Elusimicrobiota bacterium]
MKILLALPLLAALAALAAPASATPWGDAHNRATAGNLRAFASDLGGLLGGASFHSGRSLGFPGFDVGVVAMTQFRPAQDNAILRGSGVKGFGLPLVQAEFGLPLRTDVIVHGATGAGAQVAGGGLRFGALRSGMLVRIPDVAVSAFADRLTHDQFTANHYAVNASASWHLPILQPYAGVGYDVTNVELKTSVVPGLAGSEATAQGVRLTAGVAVTPLPFVYLFGAYSIRHGASGADAGLGVRF